MIPVAVGVDLCEVARIREALERTPGLAARTWTAAEIEYCERAADPAERLAARWATKEAVLKCLGGGVGNTSLVDIEVRKLDSGAPTVHLSGEAAVRADKLGIRRWLVSMTHTGELAEAVVIALGDSTGETR